MTTEALLIFTAPACPQCDRLKAWAQRMELPYREQPAEHIGQHPEANEIMAEFALNDMRLPIVWWRGRAWNGEALASAIERDRHGSEQ